MQSGELEARLALIVLRYVGLREDRTCWMSIFPHTHAKKAQVLGFQRVQRLRLYLMISSAMRMQYSTGTSMMMSCKNSLLFEAS